MKNIETRDEFNRIIDEYKERCSDRSSRPELLDSIEVHDLKLDEGRYRDMHWLNANMSFCSMVENRFDCSQFSVCQFEFVNFTGSEFYNCTFNCCDFDEATLNNVLFDSCRFENCTFMRAVMEDTLMPRSSFVCCRLDVTCASDPVLDAIKAIHAAEVALLKTQNARHNYLPIF